MPTLAVLVGFPPLLIAFLSAAFWLRRGNKEATGRRLGPASFWGRALQGRSAN